MRSGGRATDEAVSTVNREKPHRHERALRTASRTEAIEYVGLVLLVIVTVLALITLLDVHLICALRADLRRCVHALLGE